MPMESPVASYDLLLKNGTIWTPGGPVQASVGVRDGRIAAIGESGDADETFDCLGLTVLPGVIDSQVHFREPGLEAKEDLESGSRAAVLGGVVAVFEMPNTKPNTDSEGAINDKLARAEGRMWCDHAFYVGATSANAELLGELERAPRPETCSCRRMENWRACSRMTGGASRSMPRMSRACRSGWASAFMAIPRPIPSGVTMKARSWRRGASYASRARRDARSMCCT